MIRWTDDLTPDQIEDRKARVAFWGALLLAIAMIALAAHDAIATERVLDAGTLPAVVVERDR